MNSATLPFTSTTEVADGFVEYKIESAQSSVYRKTTTARLIFSVPAPAVNINLETT